MDQKHLEGGAKFDALKAGKSATPPREDSGIDPIDVLGHVALEVIHMGLDIPLSTSNKGEQPTQRDARVDALQPDQTSRLGASKEIVRYAVPDHVLTAAMRAIWLHADTTFDDGH